MTSTPENPFKPKLGRPGNRGSRFSKRVLKKVKNLSLGATSYDKYTDHIDLNDFRVRSEGDRHQFRFIVSADDGNDIEDQKSFTRELMSKLEQDLQTKLDWVAVDHFDTDHPHTHLVLRGVDGKGKDLIIAKSYMSYDMRNMASDILTQELGPRTDMELLQQARRQIDQERLTDLDRDIINYSQNNLFHPEGGTYSANLITSRLKKLSKMGLVEHQGSNYWQISPELKTTLQQMGERGDIIKTLHRNLYGAGQDHLKQKALIFGTDEPEQKHITGEVLSIGLSDELDDRRYIILDGIDGNHWYVDAGELEDIGDLNQGMIISIQAAHKTASQVDHRIADIACQNGGIYNQKEHQRCDPSASPNYIKSHIRRLESLRRYGICKRHQNGSWEIPADFTNQVEKLQKQFARNFPVKITVNSTYALDQLTQGEG